MTLAGPKLHLEPIFVGPFCRVHAQLLGACASTNHIRVLVPVFFHVSKHVRATLAEGLEFSLRVLPAEIMVDGSPRTRSRTISSFGHNFHGF